MAGEGYVDRRHPHTYLHEAVLAANGRALGTDLSLAAGKGFAPFGTDDPMVRPFVKYPANHHLAQILERAIVVGAARRGALALEAGVFNGDEPEGPGDAPNSARFADSWAARLTAAPAARLPGLELQASYAAVRSPEWATGQGADQRKQSASARYEMPRAALSPYALVEWARTREIVAGRPTFTFSSVLGEAAVRRGAFQLGARYERTARPEEERRADPFRSVRPGTDFSILGITRWQIATVAAAFPVERFLFGFIEIARLHAVEETQPSFFTPRSFYGADWLWSVSAGVRLRAGALHRRMGRYGAAVVESPSADHHMHAH
jgi:hypothetical protein